MLYSYHYSYSKTRVTWISKLLKKRYFIILRFVEIGEKLNFYMK